MQPTARDQNLGRTPPELMLFEWKDLPYPSHDAWFSCLPAGVGLDGRRMRDLYSMGLQFPHPHYGWMSYNEEGFAPS